MTKQKKKKPNHTLGYLPFLVEIACLFRGDVVGSDLYLTSKIPPSVNHYLAYRAIIKNGRPMAMSYKTPEALRYRSEFADYVTREADTQDWTVPASDNRHIYVDAVFYFPRVDMDSSNYFKVLLDSITDTKKIWKDDNVACERVQAVYYDKDNPRIELHIHPVDYIGIFKDVSHYDAFMSMCADCVRGTRNCSVQKKATEGRVQEEVINGVCTKFKQRELKEAKHGKESNN